jgi:hypothetical protein
MKEEMLNLLEEIKSLSMDRMDAITAGGLELSLAFEKLQKLINEIKK